jgi:methionine-rich copper-binding protein CopC
MTSQRTLQFVVSVALSALMAGLAAGSVLARAELVTASPADKSTVDVPPEEIVLTFTQNLDPLKSSIRVVDAAGNLVVLGGIVSARDPRELYVPLEGPLPVGAYEIRWTTFSTEDQEQARGTTTFTVAAAPSVVPSAATASPSAAASVGPSAAQASSAPTSPSTSMSDAVIPIVALIVLAALGLWLLRGRSRSSR